MTSDELDAYLRDEAERLQQAEPDSWTLVIHGVPMQVFCSVPKDRLRVMAMVTFGDDLRPDQIQRVLRANFHADARYGLHDGILWAVFVHTLSGLTETDLGGAFKQVGELVRSFGTSYSAGPMRFQWPRPRQTTGGIRRRTIEAVQDSLRRPEGDEDVE